MNKLQLNRHVATFLILTFWMSIGCSTSRPMPTTDIAQDDFASLEGKNVRLHMNDGSVVYMRVKQVDFPIVRGLSPPDVEVNLTDVSAIDFSHFSLWRTSFLIVGLGVCVYAVGGYALGY